MLIEVVNKPARVKWWETFPDEGDIFSFLSLLQETISLTIRGARRHDAHCRAEDIILHSFGLLGEVPVRTLDNADGVNPDVSKSQFSSKSNSILKSSWEFAKINSLLVIFNVGRESGEMRWCSPRTR